MDFDELYVSYLIPVFNAEDDDDLPPPDPPDPPGDPYTEN